MNGDVSFLRRFCVLLEMEVKCRVENNTVETPVCVTVMDKIVDEVRIINCSTWWLQNEH